MTIDHSDYDIVDGGHRSAQQLLFTATQLVEVIARMRQQSETRRADTERAAAARIRDASRVSEIAAQTTLRDAETQQRDRKRMTEQQARDTQRTAEATARAADRVAAQQQWQAAAKERADRATWSAAAAPRWRRDATPQDLLTAWAAATTWAGHDPQAAAAMLHTEDEISRRWPNLADRYDRLRVHDGLHPAAAMKIALTEAVNAGWDPATNPAATRRPPALDRAALLPPPAVVPPPPAAPVPAAGSAEAWAERIPSGPTASPRQVWADNPANLALRWHPTLRVTAPAREAQPVVAAATPAAAPRRRR